MAYDTIMVGFWLPDEIAKDLAIEGGEAPEELHITLTFHGKAADNPDEEKYQEALTTFAKQCKPISGKINGHGVFKASEGSDGKDVLYATFDSPELPELRQNLVNYLNECGMQPRMDHGYIPHITLKYLEPGEILDPGINEHELTFDCLTLAYKGERSEIPMNKEENQSFMKSGINYLSDILKTIAGAITKTGLGTDGDGLEILKDTQSLLSLPLVDRNRLWDSRGAERRVRTWAGGTNINFNQYWKAFFYRDSTTPDNFTSYKLQYADVVDGELKAIPRAIFAVAAALQGARGGVDISIEEQNRIKGVVSRWYARMREEFQDDTIVAPWEKKAATVTTLNPNRFRKEYTCDFVGKQEDGRLVYGVVLEPNVIDAQDDFISPGAIEKTAHEYMLKSQVIGDGHTKEAKAKVVESYIAPVDFELMGQPVKKGSWVMVTKVMDDKLWQAVKKGDYTGYSVGGYGIRQVAEPPSKGGET